MSFAIRQAWDGDLDGVVDLGVRCQADPNLACRYLSDDADSIRAELLDIDGAAAWTEVTWVALDDRRDPIGWIAAERDASMGRTWWFGPFVDDAEPLLADAVLDGLFATASRALPGVGAQLEQELVVDSRSTLLARFAGRNGFSAGPGSVVLRLESLDVDVPVHAASISRLQDDAVDVADAGALHDALFPGTHSTGERLFAQTGERFDRFVAHLDGVAVGYVATEVQHDGSLYVDYLGVDPAHRGAGLGRALIATALRARAGNDAPPHAHLTVRAANTSARRLYAGLGFIEEAVLIPYRRGFTLD